MTDNFIIILSTCPDRATAYSIARILLENNLCACANIVPGVESVYHWEGDIESSEEHLLLIKTRADAYEKIEKTIVTHHPYELPEIIAVPISAGLPEYLSWIDNNVS
jgi:periplasmic divalent cation tolerance protein